MEPDARIDSLALTLSGDTMAYAITASLRETTLIIGVPDAAAALDKVGELMLSGFQIDAVTNDDWRELSTTDLAEAAAPAASGVP